MTALFKDIIVGPIISRRLGLSLGVNLLPVGAKICNFDCIYCECGYNSERRGESKERRFAKSEEVIELLSERLQSIDQPLDVITFAGNGEPTLHPDFENIIDQTIALRDRFAPKAKISVLTNATTLHRADVVRALHRVDNNILKLDSVIPSVINSINAPVGEYSIDRVVEQLKQFRGEGIIQTMFLRSESVDNTREEYIEAWLRVIEQISPREVMIYSIDRDTPLKGIEKVSKEELQSIAQRVEALGIACITA